MGWAVGELFTARYFPPSAKAKITQLVLDLKAAFHARIQKKAIVAHPCGPRNSDESLQ